MKNNGALFKLFVMLLFFVFVIYVVKYPVESSKLYVVISEVKVHGEVKEADNRFIVKSTKLRESALPTRNLSLIDCYEKDYSSKIIQHGDYWFLRNFVKTSNPARCLESITYTTHSDFTFLNNLTPLLMRWNAPVSIAIWAPGDDFELALNSILFLRNCHAQSFLVRQFTTFHIFFEAQFLPKIIPRVFSDAEKDFLCPESEPFVNFPHEKTFKAMNNLTYPVNVGRNLARDAALTRFVLASDIELYPSSGLVDEFFDMVQKHSDEYLNGNNVYVLPIFEVEHSRQVPENKSQLVDIFNHGSAVWFHYQICPTCHEIPKAVDWIETGTDDESEMKVFATTKRQGQFDHWEPIFIGTNDEPFYDERLSWEGKSDKMTQAYIMCLLDYDFNILSNGFLVHKPGIKTVSEATREHLEQVNRHLIMDKILQEIKVFYGQNRSCRILAE